jgi:hypothetical protein
MLAYVFWHWPVEGVDLERRTRLLEAFHRSLDGDVPGLVRGGSYLGSGLPWTGAPEPIEDWWLVDDWTALGRLTEEAVRGRRTAPHTEVASTAALATAGLYGVVAGEPDALDGAHARWFAKPAGMSYDDLYAALAGALGDALLVQRQLNLGPTPEFCLLSLRPVALPAGIEPVAATRTRLVGGTRGRRQ